MYPSQLDRCSCGKSVHLRRNHHAPSRLRSNIRAQSTTRKSVNSISAAIVLALRRFSACLPFDSVLNTSISALSQTAKTIDGWYDFSMSHHDLRFATLQASCPTFRGCLKLERDIVVPYRSHSLLAHNDRFYV